MPGRRGHSERAGGVPARSRTRYRLRLHWEWFIQEALPVGHRLQGYVDRLDDQLRPAERHAHTDYAWGWVPGRDDALQTIKHRAEDGSDDGRRVLPEQ